MKREPAVQESADRVIEAFKRDVDRTLIRQNLRLTPEDRLRQLVALQRFAQELTRAGAEFRRGRR